MAARTASPPTLWATLWLWEAEYSVCLVKEDLLWEELTKAEQTGLTGIAFGIATQIYKLLF